MAIKKVKNSTDRKKDKKQKDKTESRVIPPDVLKKRTRIISEVSGLALIFIGIFLFICFVTPTPESMGIIGKVLNNVFKYLFGWGALLFPWVLIYIGLQLALKGVELSWKWILILIFLLYVDVVILVQLFRGANASLPPQAVAGDGGIIGRFLCGGLIRIVGRPGTYLFVIALGIVLIMFLTQLSLKQLIIQVLPFFVVIGKGLKKIYNFLVLRSGSTSEDDKLLNAGMEEMPDLSDIGKAKGTVPLKGQEDDEDEEPGETEPVEDESKPKRVIFFDEEDFPNDEEPVTQKKQDQPASEEIAPQASESIETGLPSFPGVEGETYELTGGKPGGYDQLNLFDTGERKRKPASDGKRPTPVKNYHYRLPPLSLLKGKKKDSVDKPARDCSKILEETLGNFGVTVKVIDSIRGPTVTRYELQPAKGVKVSKITNLANDIALALAAYSIRIEAPIPGKSAIGIEVPNHHIDPVFLRDILYEARYKKRPVLSLAFGKDITGKPVMGDLLKMPHLLIAGATGSGKSVCINSVIASILYKATPVDVQMMMVDPKRVELSLFEGIPHLLNIKSPSDHKIITDPKIATLALKTISDIMDTRYEDFVALKVRNLKEYNEKAEERIPYIVIVIDELADLMMISSSTVEQYICRIAQLGRASGIHLILATQRPSVDVITGLIKANVPSRIAFAVSSQVDSRTILDRVGAEKLLGKGDMLYLPVDASEPRRIQGAYVSGEEIEKVVDFWKKQPPPENIIPIEIEESPGKGQVQTNDEDELLPDAIEIIKMTRQASVSNLQRKMKIGYARAGRIMDQLEIRGVVGPAQGSKPRKILLPGYTDVD